MAFAERLESLDRKKHEIEQALHELDKQPHPDELAIQRLKREKLAIKDEIAVLMDGHAAEDAALQAAE